MKLRELCCKGVRGLADGTYDLSDRRTGAPLPVVLVTGGPASGKTSLLEAIAAAKEAVGAYGDPPDPRRFLHPDGREGSITATWVLSETERAHASLDQAEHTVTWHLRAPRADADPRLRGLFADLSRAHLEYFPADRQLPGASRSPFGGPSAEGLARLRARRAPDKYAGLVDGLRDLGLADAQRATRALRDHGLVVRSEAPEGLAPYRDAVAAMLPDLRLDDIDLEGGEPRFLRRSREEVTLDDLSAAEQQGVLFALAFRSLGLDDALVLVDEPELHIHAAHRARVLHALVGLGCDNQLIAATGSAELLRAAAPGQVIDLSARAGTEVTA